MRNLRNWTLVVLLLAVTTPGFAASGDVQDLTGLSLEELMAVRIRSVNVLGAHTHRAGEWMFSYRPMYMVMDGLLDGSDSIDVADVHANFMVSPTEMTMTMHMVGLMYAPTDRLTLMAMTHYVDLEMNHVTRMGGRFETSTSGLGDSQLGAHFELHDSDSGHRLIGGLKIGIPTGSTDERGDTPAGANVILPYPMQLGSGSWELRPSLTYLMERGNWVLAGDVNGIFRLDENDDGYTLGDQFGVSVRLERAFGPSFSLGGGLAAFDRDDIDGADARLNPNLVPTANPSIQDREAIDAFARLNWFRPSGRGSEGLRFAVELRAPLYESVDGPQLERDWQIQGGLQWVTSF